MNNILRKNVIWLIIYIFITVLLLSLVLIFWKKISTKMNTVYEIKERLASYQKNKQAFEDEAKEIKALEQRLTTLESYKIFPETIPKLLSTLESLATKHKISFEITSVQTPIENEKTKLTVESIAKGSFADIQSFYKEIQHQEFQVLFTKLFLFSETGATSTPESTGTLSVKGVKAVPVSKELKWQGVATIEVQSF
ncbi:MAG: hypothetical protein QG674_459 [Patescibacteria group bacterium]|jgi:flagellar basal body-associated protein FliL|nr:hypothetical protein [Patescibacteria group bacterium]